tara:strand:- start:203 stop:481 length:279 start_codon:yes stop_codon:yes gene_type:complete
MDITELLGFSVKQGASDLHITAGMPPLIRVNAFVHNRGAAAVFRTIPSKVLTMEQLGMGEVFRKISDVPRGLVVVTGPTGSGKSTTLAAMVD